MMRKPLSMVYFALHKNLEPYRFAGVFVGFKPSIMIRDPELVRNILINDFVYFGLRGVREDTSLEKSSNSLSLMAGEEWKNLRTSLTACLTKGKMKIFFSLANDYGIKLNKVLDSVCNEPDFEIRDLCSRYTTDIIGNFIFGIEINSLANPDSEIRRICNYTLDNMNFAVILRGLYPSLKKILKPFLKDTTVRKFFTKIIHDSIKYREENQIERDDYLDTVRNLCKSVENEWIESNVGTILNEISISCYLLFFAAFAPSSAILNFMMLELAQNQHIQNKLRQEIIEVLKKNDNVLTYDALKEMKYLDMVVAETMRRYPPVGYLKRQCTRSYKIPDSEVVIEEGTQVVVSILGIHYDGKNYEKPDEFYPEHFTEEAKAKRLHCTYLPFGDGPRKCLGDRSAMMQIKIGAIHLLKNYSYQVSSKTRFPVEFVPSSILDHIKGGTWLKCHKI